MEHKKIIDQIAEYLKKNSIQVRQVAKDTNVPEEKLRGENEEDLSASEFLTLCQYLNVQPEDFDREK